MSLNPRSDAEPGVDLLPCPGIALGISPSQAQDSWRVVGPDGGDARAFAAVPGQPNHLYLGTTNSWLYESLDEGATWHRLAKLDPADGFVLDSIVVDSANPSTLYVGAWKDSDDGGLVDQPRWRAHMDGAGRIQGPAVHALAQAPSNPRILIAGTLAGRLSLQRLRRDVDARSARPAAAKFTRLSLSPSIR